MFKRNSYKTKSEVNEDLVSLDKELQALIDKPVVYKEVKPVVYKEVKSGPKIDSNYIMKLNDELKKDLEAEEKKEKEKKEKKRYNKKIVKDEIASVDSNEKIINSNNVLDNSSVYHKNQILKMIKNNPDKLYVHTIEFYDDNDNLVSGIFELDEDNMFYDENKYTFQDFTKQTWKFENFTKNKWHSILFNICVFSQLLWLPKVWIANNEDNYVKIITKAYDKFNYKQRDNKQNYKNNVSNTCFYDGVLCYFKNKYDKNKDRNARAIINKLTKYESDYKKAYTEKEILSFCQDFKISITIKDYITNKDIKINHNKFNRNNIQFINTKYNHLDLLINEYNNIEEIEKNEYNEIKQQTNFYVESYGKLITLDKTYTKKKDEFKLIFNEWFEKNNLSRNFINTSSDAFKMLEQYDYNMHRFFKKYSGNENDYYEIDLKKAYYNYSDIDYNKFYMGVPSGSFINHYCDEKFTIDTFKEHVKNKLVGFYQVKIIKIKNNKNLDMFGFSLNSVHVLFSSMIMLLSDHVEFNFLNASFSPSLHIPFNEKFLTQEKNGLNDKGLKYFCKACGILLADEEEIKINIKPLDEDKEFYKTFYKNNFNVYENNGIYSISIQNNDMKSHAHITKSIHAYTTTLILNELLKMDPDNIVGVKLDSIVLNKNYVYDYDKKIFEIKEPKLKGLFENHINFSFDLDNYTTEELNHSKDGLYNNYKVDSEEILNFPIIFTPDGQYIVKRIIYFGGMGGTGKTYSILSSSLPKKNICFTSLSWDLIQNKQNDYKDIIGLSMPKLTGYCNGKKVEKIKNDNIKYIVIDEMTLTNEDEINKIINLYPDCFIFCLGDVSIDGFGYQCSINNDYYKPNDKTQYFLFSKTFRFDEILNDKLLLLREFMYNNRKEQHTKKLLNYFKSIFSDRFFKADDIKFNDNDVGISTHNDLKKENKLTDYFVNKGTKPQYYIKNTNIHNGQLRGQKLEDKPNHNNYECKLFKTIHSFQGRELNTDNNIIIFLGGLFDYNLLYTAVSRARKTEQIYIFDNY